MIENVQEKNDKKTRSTRQKQIIYEALLHADHPTATQLYEQVKNQCPSISRATVFRVLMQFSGQGLITRIHFPDGLARYDARTQIHAHLHCLVCGLVVDAVGNNFKPPIGTPWLKGFQVTAANLDYFGLCPACRKAAEEAENKDN